MQLHFKKSFVKSYQKLSLQDQGKVDEALADFQVDPFSPHLKNHALHGKLIGKRAISAGFDLRIVFREQDNHAVVFLLKVGTHNQVY